VPPRHRLDCHVFKGFGLIEVAVDAPHLVASEIHDDRVWRFDRHTAALPASPNPANYEHPVTEIAELLGEYAELTPCLGDDLEVRPDPSPPVKAPALHGTSQGREQLDVLGRVGRKRLDIATVECVNASLGNVYFFLRHPPTHAPRRAVR